jgi:hypothetical protein
MVVMPADKDMVRNPWMDEEESEVVDLNVVLSSLTRMKSLYVCEQADHKWNCGGKNSQEHWRQHPLKNR